MKPKQLIIIGGGPSLHEGLDKGLLDKIKNKFSISMNFNYVHFPDTTILTFVDHEFYTGLKRKWKDTEERRIQHIQDLQKAPLIIGQHNTNIKE